MSVTFTDYTDYFENIAKNLKAISHTEAEKHFYKTELEELLIGLQNTINYPALVLEGYDISFTDHGSDNFLKDRDGAFSILKMCNDPNDASKIYAIYESCEIIVNNILNIIKYHKEKKTHAVVKDFEFSSVEVLPIANENGGYGMRCSFRLTSNYNTTLNLNLWKSVDF
ncbi:MAG: hypothetical protein U9Q69_00215 [Nanoarchaeota archaeon]|nr:hypothetical protein [Nanoarchaeota archaeon]